MSPRQFLPLLALILIPWGAASAQTCVTPPSGLIAWWTLDETSGIVAKDSVGTEPAAYFGTPPLVQTPGLVGGALRFNGSNDFLSAANSSLWAFGTNDFTVELWANFTVVPGGDLVHAGAIFIGDDDGPGGRNKWFFALGGGLLHFTVYNTAVPPPNFYLVRAPFVPVVGQWYHLAVTKTGTTFTIYVNGVAVGSEVSLSPIASPSAPLTIGQAESLGFMNGILDEISVYNRALSQAELQAIARAGSAGKCKLSTASAVVPSAGGNAGQVTVTLSGSQFSPTSVVSLSRSGFPAINGSAPIVSTDGASLTSTFDLTGQPLGVWDVVVNSPQLPPLTLPQAFTIEPPKPPGQLWVSLVGRGAIRVGQTQQFAILFGNRGDTDALDVPIWLTGIPTTATFTPRFPVALPSTVPGFPPIDPSFPITATTPTDIQVPLVINRIPPGTIGTLPFSLLVTDTAPIQLVANVGPPLASFGCGNFSINDQAAKCALDLVEFAMDKLHQPLPQGCVQKVVDALRTTLINAIDTPTGSDIVLPYLENQLAWTEVGIACAEAAAQIPPTPPSDRDILGAVSDGFAIVGIAQDCALVFTPIIQSILNIVVVQSYDPNAKQGSQGAGPQQFLAGSALWPYLLAFENQATATAPAQSVTVTDQLDLAHLDVSTFSLGPMGFGAQQIVPPPGLSQFSTYVDLRPATNLLVRINASLNKGTGLVTWSLNSLDPSTGQPPADPTVGFLPPNRVPPQGDGQVLFSVSPKNTLNTGQQISNSASVVFDVNPPIATPAWLNTLDNTPPVSSVQPLPQTEPTGAFPVTWSGKDVGAGIRDFTIYLSDNSAAFQAWQKNTTATSATFTGQSGHTYGLYSIARDLVGNIEPPKTSAEAATSVGDTTAPVTTANLSGPAGSNGWYRGSVTITLSAADPDSPVAATFYSIDGGAAITYAASFTLSTDGAHHLSFYSTDPSGNQENPNLLTIKIDSTPPVITAAANPTTLWPPNSKMVPVMISGTITDATSGVDPNSATFAVVDQYGTVQPSGSVALGSNGAYSFTISLQAFRRGTDQNGRLYTITISVQDNAGNQGSSSTVVTVPHDQGTEAP
jgi:hypothetical protein